MSANDINLPGFRTKQVFYACVELYEIGNINISVVINFRIRFYLCCLQILILTESNGNLI